MIRAGVSSADEIEFKKQKLNIISKANAIIFKHLYKSAIFTTLKRQRTVWKDATLK